MGREARCHHFPFPTAVPTPFGIAMPSGNFTDPGYHRELRRLGAEYNKQEVHMPYKEEDEIIRKLKTKREMATYIHEDWGKFFNSNGDNINVQMNVLANTEECPIIIDKMKKVLENTPQAADITQLVQVTTTSAVDRDCPQTISVAKQKDEVKIKDQALG